MTLHHVCQLNVKVLTELEMLIHRLPDHYYTASLSNTCSPVGTHVRHIIEFYTGFLQGLELGFINYDDRPRNLHLETSAKKAIEQIVLIRRHLTLLENHHGELGFSACGGHNLIITTASNVERELLFLQDHTAHHNAIIGLLLERVDVQLPDSFGMALATRTYQKSVKALPD